jgi:hypothetical protein
VQKIPAAISISLVSSRLLFHANSAEIHGRPNYSIDKHSIAASGVKPLTRTLEPRFSALPE